MDAPTPWPDLAVAARTDPAALDEVIARSPSGLSHLRRVAVRWHLDHPDDEALVALWLVLGRPDAEPHHTVVRARQRFVQTQRRASLRDRRRRAAEQRFVDRLGSDDGQVLDGLVVDQLVALLPAELRPVARMVAEGASVHQACRVCGVGRQVWRSAVSRVRAGQVGAAA